MDALIAAMEIQMNLHKVTAELAEIRYSGGDVDALIESAQSSLKQNETVIAHLIRADLPGVQ